MTSLRRPLPLPLAPRFLGDQLIGVVTAIITAVAAAAAGGAEAGGWVALPRDAAPGPARVRFLQGGRPLALSLPETLRLPPGESAQTRVEGDVRLVFRRAAPGPGAIEPAAIEPAARGPDGITLSALLLSAPGASDVEVALDAYLPGMAGARPARFASGEASGTFLLSLGGGGLDAARGLHDASSDVGYDLGIVDRSMAIGRRPPGASSGGSSSGEAPAPSDTGPSDTGPSDTGLWVRIEGRIPRGRETVIFGARRVSGALGSLAAPGASSSRAGGCPPRSGAPAGAGEAVRGVAGHLAGRILPGGTDVVERARQLAATGSLLPGAYAEIGDGWQMRGGSRRAASGRTPPDGAASRRAPSDRPGSRWLEGPSRGWRSALDREDPSVRDAVSALAALGLRPGIWLVPHGESDVDVLRASPAAFIRGSGGDAVPDPFLGPYVVDGSSEAGLAYLRDLGLRLRETGAAVVRIGGLSQAVDAYRREAEALADPDRRPLDIVRATLRALSEGCGDGIVLAGDWDTPGDLAGALDAAVPALRESDGVDPLWREGAVSARAFPRHRSSWWVECLPVMAWGLGETPEEEVAARARSRILFAAITGRGLLMDADLLVPAGLESLAAGAWPSLDGQPLDTVPLDSAPIDTTPIDIGPIDVFPREDPPRVWALEVEGGGSRIDPARAGSAQIVLLVNWSALETVAVPLGRRELARGGADAAMRLWFDPLEGRIAGVTDVPLETLLPPASSRLLVALEDPERPAPLGVEGDFRGTVRLLAAARWDPARSALRGPVRLRGPGDLVVVHLAMGPRRRVAGASVSMEGAAVEGTAVETYARGDHVAILIDRIDAGTRTNPDATADATLEVRFEDAADGVEESPAGIAIAPLLPPRHLKVRMLPSERRPLLEWSAGEDSPRWWREVAGFAIYRDGVAIGRTAATTFLDPGARRGATYAYAVEALRRPAGAGMAGRPGEAARPAEGPSLLSTAAAFRVPRARDAYLDAWTVSAGGAAVPPPQGAFAPRASVTGGGLSVGGRRFARGLGVRAPSRIEVRLDGDYELFDAAVGVDDATRFEGSVVFAVIVDGQERFRSPVIRGGAEDPRPVRVPLAGAGSLALVVEDAGDGARDDLAVWGDARVRAPRTPLLRAHSHNDYRHERPLLDALDHGFTSVEADVFLVDGKLLVGHDRGELRPERTLEALYLDPLLDRVRANGGTVHREKAPFILLVDIKAEAEKVYAVLGETLKAYAEMLTRFEREAGGGEESEAGRVLAGAVTVILSGDRPRATLAAEPSRLAFLDGRLPDLEPDPSGAPPAPASLIPLVSQAWGTVLRWGGRGEMPEEERRKLAELVARAHEQGRKIRFWGTPDRPEMWGELLRAGVDLINADDLAGLEGFLRERE